MGTFIIHCDPVPWSAHGGYGNRSYDRRKREKLFYRQELKAQYGDQKPIETAVRIEYIFKMRIPPSCPYSKLLKIKSGELKHIKRPDCSNLVKLCEDTLKGIIIKDDSQVIEFTAKKVYDITPQTIITVTPV